jgi:hypothetical protein
MLTPARAFGQVGGPRSGAVAPRPVRCRTVEKVAPLHGEKPYEQLVADAFDGPVLRLSEKIRLLEEADMRHIRRGDALELMESVQAQIEAALAVEKPGRAAVFAKRFLFFAVAYGAAAAAACVILG